MEPSREIMLQALTLARKGRGAVEPNPMVGAVVLDSNGQIVGRGYHRKFGEAHAEVNALLEAGNRARGGTLYVTLEPCCHHGKTPPCTEAILAAGIRSVVAAMQDPFPPVAGGGLKRLRDAGLDVFAGLCEAEAKALNTPYLKRLATGMPWVHAKWAMSLDGRIAARSGDSKWISNDESRAVVHELRGRMDAIIVGAGTVRHDDPLLTARPPGPRTPVRVVVGSDLPGRCKLLETVSEAPVLVFATVAAKLDAWQRAGAEVIVQNDSDTPISIDAMLLELGRRGMTNVLLEGGAKLAGSFADAGSIDELHAFIAPILIGGGIGPVDGRGAIAIVEAAAFDMLSLQQLGNDLYWHGRRKR